MVNILPSPAPTLVYTAMAGNIIPAIATTNAVIGGLIVTEALNILAGRFDKCKMVRFTYVFVASYNAWAMWPGVATYQRVVPTAYTVFYIKYVYILVTKRMPAQTSTQNAC